MTDNEPDPLAERIAESVREQTTSDDSSRRSFLSRSAIAGGALLALGGGTGMALADHEEGEGQGHESESAFDDVEGTDLDVLNYALSLEHLESAFYAQAMETFSEDDFVNADELEGLGDEMRQAVYEHVQTAGQQEESHVEVLTQAVELLGGEPEEAANYDFPFEEMAEFLTLAQVLENTGVAAYAGAAPYIESPDLLSAALSIHSVEARHAALFNELNGVSPFPNAYDEAMSQQEVLEAIGPFLADETGTETDGTETDDGVGNETDTETDGFGNETETDGFGNETETDGFGNETETDGFGNATETDGFGNETETDGLGNTTATETGNGS